MMARHPDKFDKAECLRMTSVTCAADPQLSALGLLRADDLRAFTDLLNTADVEAGAASRGHWLNRPADTDTGATLLEVSQANIFAPCSTNIFTPR